MTQQDIQFDRVNRMIFPPTSEADPAYWSAVFAGHAFIGVVLTAIAAVVVARRFNGVPVIIGAWVAVLGYAVLWEGLYQRLGAGLGDAAVDTLAVACGAAVAVCAERRWWRGAALAMAVAIASLWLGIRRRL